MVNISESMKGPCKARGIMPVAETMTKITRQAKTVKELTAKAGW